ncbi:MAG TPA: amidohydrolase family protein, partial [Rudaea sp.]|nr:amidohydrolase family protein [Rudaea sp.]
AAVYPHGMNAKEFVYMVEAGMPTMFVIQAATTHAAQLLKHEKELGSVTPGKFADVIAVPGNPLDDITLLQKVNFVMKAGKVYTAGPKPVAALATAGSTASPEELEGF